MNPTLRRCSRKATHTCILRLDSLLHENPETPHKKEEGKTRRLRERLEYNTDRGGDRSRRASDHRNQEQGGCRSRVSEGWGETLGRKGFLHRFRLRQQSMSTQNQSSSFGAADLSPSSCRLRDETSNRNSDIKPSINRAPGTASR